MKKKIATRLRKHAENLTIGYSPDVTRGQYLTLKKQYRENTKTVVEPKFELSKRQKRIFA